jgi:hypothetical protein
VGGFTGYIPVYVGTLQWVGLLAIYQYMLVHCSGWVYWLYTSISWYTAVDGFTGYIPVYVGTLVCGFTGSISVYLGTLQWVGLLAMYQYMLVYWYIASKPTHCSVPPYTGI